MLTNEVVKREYLDKLRAVVDSSNLVSSEMSHTENNSSELKFFMNNSARIEISFSLKTGVTEIKYVEIGIYDFKNLKRIDFVDMIDTEEDVKQVFERHKKLMEVYFSYFQYAPEKGA